MSGMRVNILLSISALVLVAVIMGFGSITPVIAQVDGSSGLSDTPIAGQEKAAGPVPIDGTWFEWSFFNFPIISSFGCPPADPFAPFPCTPSTGTPTVFADIPPYTFTCPASGCTLTVTDAFNQGDEFEVFDGVGSIGTTSVVTHPLIETLCAPNLTDPEDCLLDADSSSGVFPLAAGAHDITFLPTFVQSDAGAAYFKVLAQIVQPPVGGTMIPIDTTALLLVGAQTTSAWLIPVIVVAIGFAILIARKY